MHLLDKLIEKKKKEGKKLDGSHQKARSSVLDELMGDMEGLGAQKVKNLKKVTVASDSSEGLEKGLSKAKELVEKQEDESSHESEEEELAEHEGEEDEESPEAIEAKIAELKAKLEQLKA